MWNSRIFWFGDLNYRLCLEDSFARQLIKKQDWIALKEFDQLRREQEDGRVFQGWKEGNIDFAPTYKYSSSNHNRYSGGLPSRSGEKQRTPAWYNYHSHFSLKILNCLRQDHHRATVRLKGLAFGLNSMGHKSPHPILGCKL